jgi:hypothetical protein
MASERQVSSVQDLALPADTAASGNARLIALRRWLTVRIGLKIVQPKPASAQMTSHVTDVLRKCVWIPQLFDSFTFDDEL